VVVVAPIQPQEPAVRQVPAEEMLEQLEAQVVLVDNPDHTKPA
jgi:hypothetical protein